VTFRTVHCKQWTAISISRKGKNSYDVKIQKRKPGKNSQQPVSLVSIPGSEQGFDWNGLPRERGADNDLTSRELKVRKLQLTAHIRDRDFIQACPVYSTIDRHGAPY
jgi:hypothetical protein